MRFMIMHKMTEEMEKGGAPDPEIIEGVGKLVGEAVKGGIFVAGEGLKPSSQRTHVAYRKGKRTITDGPFTEAKELVAGFALMRVNSKEEVIGWCDRFAAVLGDVELFIGPVVEPWDLGMMPKPADAPLRYLSMHKMDERAENDAPPDPALMEKIGALVDEMTKAGVLQSTGGLASTKKGARIHFKGGKRTVVDGPFAESKELIAGFAILDLPSKAAAIEWATRFGEIVKVDEVEIRQMPEW
ncbi:MAG: YciI family protein [Polyangiales bacterium]